MNKHGCAVCGEAYEYEEDVDRPELCDSCWAKQYFGEVIPASPPGWSGEGDTLTTEDD